MDSLLNTAPCGFLAFADDGTVRAVNATLLELLGYGRFELEGWHIQAILSPGGRVFYQTHFYPLLKLNGRVDEIYLSLRTKSGEDVPMLANGIRRERGGETLNDCVFMRVTQRSRYEDEILNAKRVAEQANQAKAKFLSMMSHDLRTPLQAISGYADVLALGISGEVSQMQLEHLSRIKSASAHLLRLINDILDFAQIDTGRVEIRIQNLLLPTVLTRAEALVALRFEEAGLSYTRECDPDLAILADSDRLQQILLNLLTNAIKFTESGGVTVSCDHDGERAFIHVKDTGRGIPEDHLQRIFDPFVQVDAETVAPAQRGVGLGLAISHDLARAMDGDLTVASKVGEGTVFTVALPLA
ncbi:MAG TPA: PAS domain-containing sensor histidine kinase [Thermoanaerobaculia bacterium]|nr:PAS domain-containing sensor histidine kinase [Thermoanaerobaculia bacterium]